MHSCQIWSQVGNFTQSCRHLFHFGTVMSLMHSVFRIVPLTLEAPQHFLFRYVACECQWVTPAVIMKLRYLITERRAGREGREKWEGKMEGKSRVNSLERERHPVWYKDMPEWYESWHKHTYCMPNVWRSGVLFCSLCAAAVAALLCKYLCGRYACKHNVQYASFNVMCSFHLVHFWWNKWWACTIAKKVLSYEIKYATEICQRNLPQTGLFQCGSKCNSFRVQYNDRINYLQVVQFGVVLDMFYDPVCQAAIHFHM